MAVSFKRRVTVPSNVMVRELEGESVILNVDTERYFGLDDVGTRMWQAVTGSGSIQTAYDELLDKYDVEPDVLRRDLMKLIEQLVEFGLVECHGE